MDEATHFIETFATDRWKQRLIDALSSPRARARTRARVAEYLTHERVVDQRWVIQIPELERGDFRIIYDKMKQCGASDECWCCSTELDWIDNKTLQLRNALAECVGHHCPTLVYCRHERIAYVEGASTAFMLSRST